MDHAYNASDIGPHEFLLAIMHDPHFPLQMRMKAAEELLRVGFNYSHVPTLKVIIEGGMPDHVCVSTSKEELEFPAHFSEELKQDLKYIKHCYDVGLEDLVRRMKVHGHS